MGTLAPIEPIRRSAERCRVRRAGRQAAATPLVPSRLRRVSSTTTIALVIVAALLASGGRAVAGTSTVTVDWTGNSFCSVCSGNFSCSSDLQGWDHGVRSFVDPVPAGAVVTSVSVTVFAVFECSGAADVEVELQGTTVAEHSVSGDTCQCNSCNSSEFATTAAAGWPGYAYGGRNTLFLNLHSGIICADRAEITLAWADTCGNGTIEPYETCDDGNTTDGDGCSGRCQAEPCYSCSGAPSTCSPQSDGTACDDGLFCNGADTCSGAACSVHNGDPCVSGAECNNVCNEAAHNCQSPTGTSCADDGNVCTLDQCDGAGACDHLNNDLAPCDDGVFCNGPDECFQGTCQFHSGDPCVGQECATGCDELAGQCDPRPAGQPCADDGEVCTTDQCDGMGACAHPPAAAGLPCPDDGLACTADQCDGDGFCAHPPLAGGAPCPDDGNDCTIDECNGVGLCIHPPQPDGAACDDANACTQTDRCAGGQCLGTDPVVCTVPACHEPPTCDVSTGTCTVDTPLLLRSDCRSAAKTKFRYENRANDARDRLQWKWLRGAATTPGEFGDPTTSADYQFCVFAETDQSPLLLMSAEVPPSTSSWRADGPLGYVYDDRSAGHDGMQRILLKGGADGRSKVVLEGKGPGLSDPPPLLPPTHGVRVQLSNQASGICWESELPPSAITGGLGNHGP